MSSPIYNITLSTAYDSGRRQQIECYVIDRVPQGPMSSFTELQDGVTACDPCGSSLSSTTRNKAKRYMIRMPDAVKRAYMSPKSDYVDDHTLPGFISWMSENGYDTLDFKHVVGLQYGFWVQYSDSSSAEFRGARSTTSRNLKKKF